MNEALVAGLRQYESYVRKLRGQMSWAATVLKDPDRSQERTVEILVAHQREMARLTERYGQCWGWSPDTFREAIEIMDRCMQQIEQEFLKSESPDVVGSPVAAGTLINQGRRAAIDGEPRSANPYSLSETLKRTLWDAGWIYICGTYADG